jgi:hypothetical protein
MTRLRTIDRIGDAIERSVHGSSGLGECWICETEKSSGEHRETVR